MQKWEYLEITNAYGGGGLYGKIVSAINSEPTTIGKGGPLPEFYAYVNQLGEEGWELVGIDSDGSDWVFKRPKP